MSETAIQLPEEKVNALKGIVSEINKLIGTVGDLTMQIDDSEKRIEAAKAEVLEAAGKRQELLKQIEEEFGQGMINLEEGTLVQE
jgi:peptidoglycan hydrolase CwlO-like protein